ncbi:MAG: IS1182 family transposase [Chitinophagales bacterium]
MQVISSHHRHQLEVGCLEEMIERDHPVRFIDAFVEHIELERLGFQPRAIKQEGRPGFEARLFLKIYLYGYLNGIRSSRRLAKECVRNIELQWLCVRLQPNYHSICDFRKDNANALRNTFKLFVSFLKEEQLVRGETIAIDGTKVRAHNSKKQNFSAKKLERHMCYIETKTNEYLNALAENDLQEEAIKVSDVAKKIERLKTNKIYYEHLQEKLAEIGDTQISVTDGDARALLVQGQVVEVAYNVQAAVDDQHNLVVATHTINKNDRNALSAIAKEAKANLQVDTYTALVDKGYHNGGQLQQCQQANITTIVAAPELVNSNEYGTTAAYMVTQFTYDKSTDTYKCPQGETLYTKGTWHKKTRERDSYLFKKYRTPKCKACAVKSLCTGRQKGGRELDRSQYAEAVEINNRNYKNNAALYRKRQEINEHIFGTIKRKWNYYYTDLKGLEKVNGEYSLIMLVYNMKRCFKIVGVEKLIAKIKNWKPEYSKPILFAGIMRQIEAIWRENYFGKKYSEKKWVV